MKPTEEQRAAWIAHAEDAAGQPPPGWLEEIQQTKPKVVECDDAKFFALCRLQKNGYVTIYGMKNKVGRWVLSVGWPELVEVQPELI